MNCKSTTIVLGGEEVPVIGRPWVSAVRMPHKKTYNLLPGQHWSLAEETSDQWEYYVKINNNVHIPVGALIAQDLVDEGAIAAAFTEQWAGKCVLINQNLFCVSGEGGLVQILDNIRHKNNGCLNGLPNVMALFPDGRVLFRETKHVRAKDGLGQKKHDLATLLRQLYGNSLDLAVVEWGSDKKQET